MTDNQELTVDKSNLIEVNDETNQTKGLDVGKALKLRLYNNLSYQEIGDKLGFHKTTVFYALKPFKDLLKNPAQIQAYRENKAQLLDAAQMELLSQITNEEKLKKATLGNIAYGIGQIDNITRAERGLPNVTVNYHVLLDKVEDLEAEEERLKAQIEGN